MIVYTFEDFEQCSMVLRGQNRANSLIEPFGGKLDKFQREIAVLQVELEELGKLMDVSLKEIDDASAAEDWLAEELAIRKHNSLVEKGNIVAMNARYLSQLHQVVQQGLGQRTELFNRLNTEYLSNCVHEWPPAIIDAACLVDAPTTYDFCEKF